MKLFLQWFVATLAILIAAYIVPSASVTLAGALVLAIVLAILNLFLRPVLFVLTLPITILTLGLFSLVVNALLVWFAAAIVPGVHLAGFWSALFFSVVLTLVNWIFHLWSES